MTRKAHANSAAIANSVVYHLGMTLFAEARRLVLACRNAQVCQSGGPRRNFA